VDDSDDNTVEKDVAEQMVAVISDHDLQDGLSAIADVGLSHAIDAIGTIPALSEVVKGIRAIGGIRDAWLLTKLAKFLREVHRIPVEERASFFQAETPNQRKRFGAVILLLLDRLDHLEKPELVAALFRAMTRGELDRAQFEWMAAAVERLLMPQIRAMVSFYKAGVRPTDEVLQALAFVGAVRVVAKGNGAALFDASMAGAVLEYEKNVLGQKLVDAMSLTDTPDDHA
jgi:hypothetical protein